MFSLPSKVNNNIILLTMKFARKLLVKDYKKTDDPKVRARYGLSAGIFGIITNALLCAFKLAVGFLGHSVTIIADAVNNLSDAGSSVVTLVGFRLSAMPPDKKHPFGHARYEYITELLVAMVILFIGIMLLKSSIEKCITPEVVSVNVFTYVVLGVAILMKLFQMLLYLDFSKAIDSGALKASAADSRNDVIATTVVLISSIVIDVTGVNIDGYAGIAVSLFIVISSVLLLKDAMSPILGEKPDEELVNKIKAKILSYDGIIGMHDLVVHSYGANQHFAIAHVEVPANESILVSHDLIDNIEHDLWNEMHVHLNLHLDPVDTENTQLAELKLKVTAVLESLDSGLSLHDFRMVPGDTHTNLVFDVVVPFESKLTHDGIIAALEEAFKDDPVTYYFVIDIDRQMS